MKLDINGMQWLILEVEESDEHLILDGKELYGSCNYDEQKIYLLKTMSIGRKKRTLIHELVHAFAYEYLLKFKENYDNEEVCEFLSKYGERILEIARKYIDVKYLYTKGC